jgi:hypothetical protein
MKVTWTSSGRIHRTVNGLSTVCGHVFAGPGQAVHGELHVHKKKFCKTCFTAKPHYKLPWLQS